MKSVKYKFSSDIYTADCVARHYLLELYFLRIFFFRILKGSTQFITFITLQLQLVLSEKWNFVRL